MHLETSCLHQLSCGPVSSANNNILHLQQFLVGPALVTCHRVCHVLNFPVYCRFLKARFS